MKNSCIIQLYIIHAGLVVNGVCMECLLSLAWVRIPAEACERVASEERDLYYTRGCPDGLVVYGRCYWLLAVAHHCLRIRIPTEACELVASDFGFGGNRFIRIIWFAPQLIQATLLNPDMSNLDFRLNRTKWKVPVPSYAYISYTHNPDFA